MQYDVILDVLHEAETWDDSAVKARVYKCSNTVVTDITYKDSIVILHINFVLRIVEYLF